MFKKSTDSTLAIDLAPDAVRILDVTFRRGTPYVTTLASGPIEAGEAATMPDRHLAALGSLLSANRIRARQCVAAVPTNLVVTRSVTIDPSKSQPPEEQVRVTLQNCLPYDPRDLLFDFWPVTETGASAANRTREVLVVATQGSVVQRYLHGFTKLRLACVHLDAAPCALASLIARLLPNQDAMVGAIALTGSVGFFAVVEKQRVLFCRPFDIPTGSNKPPAATIFGRIGDEISKCVSHMVGTLHLDCMTEVFAFGDGSQDEAFGSYLVNRFNLQVRTPSPFESLPADALSSEMKPQPELATHYATALGLALQTTGGAIHG